MSKDAAFARSLWQGGEPPPWRIDEESAAPRLLNAKGEPVKIARVAAAIAEAVNGKAGFATAQPPQKEEG